MRTGVEGKSVTEYALLAGEVRLLQRVWPARPSDGARVAGARTRDTNPVGTSDLWRAVGGTFRGNDLRMHDLAAVLSDSDPPAVASRDDRDGVPLIRVVSHGKPVKGPAFRQVQWFDPARGYIPVRSEAAMSDGSSSDERSGLTQYADGVWLPTRSVSEARAPHGTYRSEIVVPELKVNEPLPAGSTTLLLPAGTNVKDELRGTEYKGNPDWTPAGPEKKWQPLRIPKPADPGPDAGPTREEPASCTRWVVIAAASLLAIGLVGLGVRRWRSRRRNES